MMRGGRGEGGMSHDDRWGVEMGDGVTQDGFSILGVLEVLYVKVFLTHKYKYIMK